MKDRTITQGETPSWVGSFTDEDGDTISFASSDRTATMRIRKNGSTSVALTKVTTDATDWTWTSQSTGVGYWTFTATETAALATGLYIVDVVYADASTTPTTTHIVGGPVQFTVRKPRVSAL